MARRAELFFSPWHRLFDGLRESTQKVYTAIEKEIRRQKIPLEIP